MIQYVHTSLCVYTCRYTRIETCIYTCIYTRIVYLFMHMHRFNGTAFRPACPNPRLLSLRSTCARTSGLPTAGTSLGAVARSRAPTRKLIAIPMSTILQDCCACAAPACTSMPQMVTFECLQVLVQEQSTGI